MSAMSWLLAQAGGETRQEMMQRLGHGFNREVGSNDLVFVAIIGVFALGLLVLGREYFGRRKTAVSRSRNHLKEALGVLGLTRAEREAVLRLAFLARLPEPAAMLLSPANLAHAVARGLAVASDAQIRNRLADVCVKVFGQALPDAAPRARSSGAAR